MITLSNLNKDDERLISLSSFIVFYTKKYTYCYIVIMNNNKSKGGMSHDDNENINK